MANVDIARLIYRRSDYGYTVSIWLSGASRAHIHGRGRTRAEAYTSATGKLASYLASYGYEVAPDDWEGPPAPEYSERDPEAYDEMVREDMEGKS